MYQMSLQKDIEKCVTTAGAERLAQYSSSVNGKSLTALVAAETWHHRTCMQDL